MKQNLWVFKTVEGAERASQVDDYNDELSSRYNYDSNVKNYKNIRVGDRVILIDKKKILGFAEVEDIEMSHGKKTIRRCPNPDCGSTTIDKRKTLYPPYRCNRGHEFDEPSSSIADVKKFTVSYPNTFRAIGDNNDNLQQLQPYFTNGYNRNNSIQLLAEQALTLFKHSVRSLKIGMPASEAIEQVLDPYQSGNKDERPSVYRQIKERRGQQKFRGELFERYGASCMITGCRIKDILEAAHINPYRGLNDNHLENGLILRADIHTLFDLDLLGIDPITFQIHFNPIVKEEYQQLCNKELRLISSSPSQSSLEVRWELFKAKAVY